MPATTTEEIRHDPTTGKYHVWEVTTSDVPGEGGRIRRDEVNLTTLTAHELGVRTTIEQLKARLALEEQKLATALEYKAQLAALQV